MGKLKKYNGSVELMAGITQKGGGDFALIDANAVQTKEDGTRLDAELSEINAKLEELASSDGEDDITVDSQLSTTSTNPVQNLVITGELSKKQNSIILSAVEPSDEVPVGTMWLDTSKNTIAYAKGVGF